jgi:polyphenol oxidase
MTLGSPLLSAIPGLRHAFFSREGGVSEGIYASLNGGLGSQDDPANVVENRRRMAEQMGVAPENLLGVHQIHSPDVAVAAGPWQGAARPRADAIVTRTEGIAIGVTAADCGPILFVDPKARVIGAAHAGWKGALTGVVEATIDAMEKLGARRERLRAAIGPCIGRDSYEVGPEFPAPFLKRDEADAAFFRAAPRAGHFLFDLAGYLVRRIGQAGVAVEATGHDTLAGDADFFSYRRNTLKGVRDYGRGLSAIALED